MRFTPSDSAHYVTRGINPVYVDGGIKEARKVKAAPSATTVLKVVNKPAVTVWLQNNVLDSAWESKGEQGSKEEWQIRVKQAVEEKQKLAPDLGTAFHSAIEAYLSSGVSISFPGLDDTCRDLMAWLDLNVKGAKSFLIEKMAYSKYYDVGGRCDIHGVASDDVPFVFDYKTQNVKLTKTKNPKPGPQFYPEWHIQLEYYSEAFFPYDKNIRLSSLVISTNPEAQGVFEKTWEESAHMAALGARKLWGFLNGWDAEGYGVPSGVA